MLPLHQSSVTFITKLMFSNSVVGTRVELSHLAALEPKSSASADSPRPDGCVCMRSPLHDSFFYKKASCLLNKKQ